MLSQRDILMITSSDLGRIAFGSSAKVIPHGYLEPVLQKQSLMSDLKVLFILSQLMAFSLLPKQASGYLTMMD